MNKGLDTVIVPPTALIGAWTLKAFQMITENTGAVHDVFGPDPQGALLLMPDGRMTLTVCPNPMSTNFMEGMVSYTGRFRLEKPDLFITGIDVAWFQPISDSKQARRYELEGNNLRLISRWVRSEVVVSRVLTWVREDMPMMDEPPVVVSSATKSRAWRRPSSRIQ